MTFPVPSVHPTHPIPPRHAPRRDLPHRPRVGIVKFASCDGCQLTLLDLEDELLDIAERVDLVEFPEATSRRSGGPFDIVFVEGAVSTPEQVEELYRLRREARLLVTIGACATAGGIQAIRNVLDHDTVAAGVYPEPGWVETLETATPVADHVPVDAALPGCPIDGGQLVELLTAVRVGRRPQLPDEAVCAECKRRGVACLLVTRGIPCLGPVTRTGCGAICPRMGRGCYGCFGPQESANPPALARSFAAGGDTFADAGRRFAMFTNWAPPFRAVIAEFGGLEGHPDATPHRPTGPVTTTGTTGTADDEPRDGAAADGAAAEPLDGEAG